MMDEVYHGISESCIVAGLYLRIPPHPDLPPGLTTRECRLPKNGEMYMDLFGFIRQAIGDYKYTGVVNIYGWQRWIIEDEPKAVEPVQEPPIEQVEAELAANGITGISFSAAGKLFKCIADMGEIVHWAQAVLTAWNSRPLAQECLLHKKLREVMIAYRRARAKSAAEPAPANPCVRKIVAQPEKPRRENEMAIPPERLAQLRKELWGPRHQELIDEIDQLTRKLAEAKAMLRYVDIAAKTRKKN